MTTVAVGAVLTCGVGEARAEGDQEEEINMENLVEPTVVEKPRYFSPQEVEAMVDLKAREAGLNPVVAKMIAWCESRFGQFAKNRSGASGVFQIMPTTWQNVLDKFLPLRKYEMNIWDAGDNIDAAFALWKNDGSHHWKQCGG